MPWCDPCSVYHASADVDDGQCPDCGESVSHDDHVSNEVEEERTVGQSAPWHFWIVVVALIAYIVWRIVDLIMAIF